MDTTAELQLAFDVSDAAGRLALAHFEAGVSSTPKPDGTPVTEADREVELLVRDLLSVARPDDALLGEELGELGASERVWIVDPIDGTSFFARRDPHWRVHLALAVAGRVELAVVTAPALRRCWWAVRGGGSYESSWPRDDNETRRLHVGGVAAPDEARVAALDDASRRRLGPLLGRTPTTPLPLVELVRGEVDAVAAEGFHVWDHAPWVLLVEEAGGRFTDPNGGHAPDRGGLYSTTAVHQQLLDALGYPRC